MNTSRPDSRFTYEHYQALAASTDKRYELIDGNLYMVPAPFLVHQVISMNLLRQLDRHVSETACGRVFHAPLDVVLGQGETRSVVQPDILFISTEHAGIMTADEVVGAPDLIVEILSRGTARRDKGKKKALYARSGVHEYWVVDPDLESVELYSLRPNGYARAVRHGPDDKIASEIVPGFETWVADVFRDLP